MGGGSRQGLGGGAAWRAAVAARRDRARRARRRRRCRVRRRRAALAHRAAGRRQADARPRVRRGPGVGPADASVRDRCALTPGVAVRKHAPCSMNSGWPRSPCAGCSKARRCRPRWPRSADGATTRGHALVQELAYGTLRHWGRLDALTQALAAKPLTDLPLAALMAVAIYQLDHTHAPAFAVVDRAVEAAALMGRPQAKPLVNALLRRYLRERDALNAQVAQASPVARWSYPRWWIGRVEADHPQHWAQILAAGNERPPLTLRVNRRVTSREALLTQFAATEIGASPLASGHHRARAPSGDRAPGLCRGRVLACRTPARNWRRRCCGGRRHARAGCLRGAGRQDHASRRACRRSISRRSTATKRALRACARIWRDCGSAAPSVHRWSATPAIRRVGGTGVRSTASLPTSRARRRASSAATRTANGCGASRDIAAFGVQQRRILAGLVAAARAGRPAALRDVLGLRWRKTSCKSSTSWPRTRMRCANPSAFRPNCAHEGGQLLPSGNGAGHNQDGFFYALLRKA